MAQQTGKIDLHIRIALSVLLHLVKSRQFSSEFVITVVNLELAVPYG